MLMVLLLLAVGGCAAGKDRYAGRLVREDVLPDSYISQLAGVPMVLAYDRMDITAGYLGWAWEEAEGMPKILTVDIRYPPTDCDKLYEEAKANAEGMNMPQGVSACYDARAAHVRIGDYYVRLAVLGISSDMEALEQVIGQLAAVIQTE